MADMTVREKMGARAEKLARARELHDQTDNGKRDFSAAEQREWNGLLREAQLLGAEIDSETATDPTYRGWRDPDWRSGAHRPEPDGDYGSRAGAGVSVIGRTPEGQEIRALSHGASLVEELRDRFHLPAGIEPRELSVGRYLKGCLVGDWRGAEPERELRSVSGSYDPAAGFLLPSPLSAQIVDLARAQSVLSPAGARILPMDGASLTIARLDADPTAYWKREKPDVEATEDDTTDFGAVELHARTLIAIVRSSLELVQDAPNFGDAIERALSRVMGLKLDQAGLIGDGTDSHGWITGLANLPAPINLVDASGALADWDEFSQAVELCRTDNGEPNAAIVAPRDLGALDRLKEATTNAPLKPPESWEKLRKWSTTSIPTNLGAGSNESVAFVGGFDECVIGMRMQITIEASQQAGTAFKSAAVLFRAIMRAGFVVLRPQLIAKIYGITS